MSRQPFTGSCHCGQTKHIIYLTIPHKPSFVKGAQNVYRCNCSICHKAGIFHVRVNHAPDDFLVLSPTDPLTGLGDYTCNDGDIHFMFCKNCGTRCFSFMGPSATEDLSVEGLGLNEEQKKRLGLENKETIQVWRPGPNDWKEGRRLKPGMYLSVNGHSIDQGQEGFDMGVLSSSNHVAYLDYYNDGEERGTPRLEKPFPCGSY